MKPVQIRKIGEGKWGEGGINLNPKVLSAGLGSQNVLGWGGWGFSPF